LFWLSDEAWGAIEPYLPQNQPGARRVDDRRVISGIIHMLKCNGRNRRLTNDFEQTVASATTWIFIASIELFVRRIAKL
jgi:transposase